MSLSEVAVDDVIDMEEEPMAEEDGSQPQVISLVCAMHATLDCRSISRVNSGNLPRTSVVVVGFH